ncbi:MAG: aldo/keto reductase [Chlorobi bacterium]|nr:aldo/keto reductase [Chlorobiota bacterium]
MNLSIDRKQRPSQSDAIALLQRAVDEYGVEFIDTADAYALGEDDMGYCERLIAGALQGERRERVVVATKGGFTRPGGAWKPDGRPEYLRRACEKSLAALGTDRIDLYQLHRPDPAVPIEESIGALVDLQREGKIRHIGVSNVSLEQLKTAMGVTEISSIQNPLSFPFYDESRGTLLTFCEEHGITYIAYAPVGGHRNASMLAEFDEWIAENIDAAGIPVHQLALAWLLRLSPATLPIPATTNPGHLARNMRAGDIPLASDDVEKLKHARSWRNDVEEALAAGDLEKEIAAMRKGLSFAPESGVIWYDLSCALIKAGRLTEGFDALESAIGNGFNHLEHVRSDEDFAAVRDEPRFQAALDRMAAIS